MKWFAILLMMASPLHATPFNTAHGAVDVSPVIEGLDEPWAIAFLPDGGVLVTERDGELLLFKDDKRSVVRGTPKVYAQGQGGLLDVVVSRDFASSRRIFLTYAKPGKGGASTALMVGRLINDGSRIVDAWDIYEQANKTTKGHHFGSRVVEGLDETLYLTIGDRGQGKLAQDASVANGSVIRLHPDGSVPKGNGKFKGGLPELFSIGHRNPQGAAIDAKGRLWTVEHGPRGGDEVNQPVAGKNYGWPVISYGVHYSGRKVGEGTSKAGMEQPKHYWDPSIAPSGMMIYQGKMFPEWRGNMFIGSLKFDYISRLDMEGAVKPVEKLFFEAFSRIRDIREAPDGSIWFASVGDGTIYRISLP